MSKVMSKGELINTIVADFQRILIYPDMGYQIFQPIEQREWGAYVALKGLGYTKNLINPQSYR